VYGTHDHVTPPASVAPLTERVGSARADTVVLKTGHIGLLVGGSARKQTLPKVTAWLASADADGKDGAEADGKDGKDRR
jgi:polyhydroxyalkanoate synthase